MTIDVHVLAAWIAKYRIIIVMLYQLVVAGKKVWFGLTCFLIYCKETTGASGSGAWEAGLSGMVS